MKCRHCQAELFLPLVNLGYAPPSNAYRTKADLNKPELFFPLRVWVCQECWLVQTEDYNQADELFSADYAYFSSTSSTWLLHSAKFVKDMISQLGLNHHSFVIEIASNDGYLLKNFVTAEIPCLGIEPTISTAAAAEKLGIPVLKEFFNEALGQKLKDQKQQADLVIGNNVYAHVPNINDFTRGLKHVLKPSGTISLEFPHLLNLIKYGQFDTIYHEHFSYLSLYTVQRIFRVAGLKLWDVKTLPTHGGSLRVLGCHDEDPRSPKDSVNQILQEEREAGLQNPEVYLSFQTRVDTIKNNLLSFLIEQKQLQKLVVAYGAAAKGNTLLNYAGVKPDLLPYVYDAALSKQGKFLPGSHIPIIPSTKLIEQSPDYLLILPWNIAEEIMTQYVNLRHQGTRFVTAVPQLEVK
jgi:SAM-dependent methyltransferase